MRFFSIRNGSDIRFSEYKWPDNATLREQYPTLYNIVRHRWWKRPHLMCRSEEISSVLDKHLEMLRYIILSRFGVVDSRIRQILMYSQWERKILGDFHVQGFNPLDNNKKIWKMVIPLNT
jgi:hypothetical protein